MATRHNDLETSAGDLGPLAWVLDETRKSIETATKALKRYAHDVESARGVDLQSVDANPLRMARQQLHQVEGALDMVGQTIAARMVGGMEGAVQRFVARPQEIDQKAVVVQETAGFALVEYLESQLGGQPRPALGLFPQYCQVQELAGAERIHPADLWDWPWEWAAPQLPAMVQTHGYSSGARQRLDRGLLGVMHSDTHAAADLSEVSLGLSAGERANRHPHPAAFWLLAAGFFQALGCKLIAFDLYAKRAASRVLLQYTALTQGGDEVADQLAHDLLFFCAQARPANAASVPALAAVRAAWGLDDYTPVDYSQPMFGLYDPGVLSLARRRVDAVKENWSALAGGDMSRLKVCTDQLGLVAESLARLLPKAQPLADELKAVMAQIARTGQPPSPELAMETATAVLFLEASFADFHPADSQVGARMQQLADRLDAVRRGAAAAALEPWMEALYRQVSDRQTMGTVVSELRVTMGEVEGHLDQFFRNPQDKAPLAPVPNLIHQMRGVLSVLGLDQAVQAVGRMREQVEHLMTGEASAPGAQGGASSSAFEKLGNSLGALGFLVDMLGYQPALARKLFVYDAASGELKAVIARASAKGKGHTGAQARAGATPEEPAQPVATPVPPATVPAGLSFEADGLDFDLSAPGKFTVSAEPDAPQTATGTIEFEHDAAHVTARDEKPAATSAPAAPAVSAASTTPAAQPVSPAIPAAASPVAAPAAAASASQASATPAAPNRAAQDIDDDLLDIFLDEAREVIAGGQSAIEALAAAPQDMEQKTTLRRAFHTLKGSSRMVGLTEFGEAAWALEQVLNVWLAEQKPVQEDLRDLAASALAAFARWTEDIAAQRAGAWSAAPFRRSADALRLRGECVPLELDADDGAAAAEPAAEPAARTADFASLAPVPFGTPAAPASSGGTSASPPAPAAARFDPASDPAHEPDFEPTVFSHEENAAPSSSGLNLEPPSVPAVTLSEWASEPVHGPDFESTVFSGKEKTAPLSSGLTWDQPPAVAQPDPASEPVREPDFQPTVLFDTHATASAPADPAMEPITTEGGDPLDFDWSLTHEVKAAPSAEPPVAAPAAVASAPTLDFSTLPDLDLSPGLPATPAPVHPDVGPDVDNALDFSWDLDPVQDGATANAPVAEEPAAPAESAAHQGAEETTAEATVPAGDAQELDFSAFEQALEASKPQPLEQPTDAAPAKPADEPVDKPADSAVPALPPLAAVTPTAPTAPAPDEQKPAAKAAAPAAAPAAYVETFKQIGSLRISAELYDVYLEEAEGWSRDLSSELARWAQALDKPAPERARACAHSLAGSSATVGFMALSHLARAVEHALERLRGQDGGQAQQVRVLGDAASEIRGVLHQFAAGALHEPRPAVLDAVNAIDAVTQPTPVPSAPASASSLPVPAVTSIRVQATAPVAPAAQPAAPAAIASPAPPAPVVTTPVPAPAQAPVAAPAPAPITVKDAPRHAVADNIDVTDTVDPDLFPIFEEEAADLLPQLAGSLREWIASPGNGEACKQVKRFLHTLKGSARLVGALRLGEMAHRAESAIDVLGAENVSPADLDMIQDHIDDIEAAFGKLQADTHNAQDDGGADLPAADVPAAQASAPAPVVPAPVAPAPVAAPVPAPVNLATPPAAPQPAAPLAQPSPAPAASQPVAPVQPASASTSGKAIAPPAPLSLRDAHNAATQVVRVKTQLLDHLLDQAGELMTSRSRLEGAVGQLRAALGDLTGNLDRIRAQLRDVELQAETQMQSRMALTRDEQHNFDPLEFDRFTRMQELTRIMAESVNDVATVQRTIQRAVESGEDGLVAQARQSRELQRDLLRTRMVEFESLSERLYRVVRQASKEEGKQVRLDIVGGAIEVDRGVLERMTAPFEHLLRNSVVHGIEAAPLRAERHKDATGVITIDVRQAGNDVSIEFRDDGNGLDLQRIRQKAEQRGLIAPGQTVAEGDIANLVFASGLSTASKVSELAGRGVGMDVVRTEVLALGGRIETQTRPGQGSSFRLVLPLTTAVTQVVMLRAGDVTIGVPANLVEIVRRVNRASLQQAIDSGVFPYGEGTVPFFWGGALLQSSPRSQELSSRSVPVIIFHSAAQRLALHIDEVLGNQEVVVKPLGPQLSRLPGLVAVTALASGAVSLIYNPVALASVYGQRARAFAATAQPAPQRAPAAPALAGVPGGASGGVLGGVSGGAPATQQRSDVPLVLVVDDSITVRRVTQRLLQRQGYRVALAADGLQGLEQLHQERPMVVLSDIEMPRMDGFDFVRNIRADEQLRNLPVIMITSRIAEKHREHARELGVDHYLGKPYSEEELLAIIRNYAAQAAAQG